MKTSLSIRFYHNRYHHKGSAHPILFSLLHYTPTGYIIDTEVMI